MSSDTGAGPASDLATVRLLLDKKGTEMYGGEAVTQAQHALQCGALAEAAGASPALITAAFLHDIGHLLDEDFEVAVAEGRDLVHEEAGARWLASIGLPDSVCQPVRLHVPGVPLSWWSSYPAWLARGRCWPCMSRRALRSTSIPPRRRPHPPPVQQSDTCAPPTVNTMTACRSHPRTHLCSKGAPLRRRMPTVRQKWGFVDGLKGTRREGDLISLCVDFFLCIFLFDLFA